MNPADVVDVDAMEEEVVYAGMAQAAAPGTAHGAVAAHATMPAAAAAPGAAAAAAAAAPLAGTPGAAQPEAVGGLALDHAFVMPIAPRGSVAAAAAIFASIVFIPSCIRYLVLCTCIALCGHRHVTILANRDAGTGHRWAIRRGHRLGSAPPAGHRELARDPRFQFADGHDGCPRVAAHAPDALQRGWEHQLDAGSSVPRGL